MGGGIDSHRHRVRILACDPLINVEQVPVLLTNRIQTEPLNSISEVQVDALPVRPNAAPLIADIFGISGGDVAGNEVAKTRIASLQIVVALVLRDVLGGARFTLLLRHPYASVIPQRLRHQRQLGLMLAAQWDTGRMNLREARVPEQGAPAVGAPYGSTVGRLGIGREVEDVRVPSRPMPRRPTVLPY